MYVCITDLYNRNFKKETFLCLLLTIGFNGYSQLKIDAYGKLSSGNIVPVSSFKAGYEGWGIFTATMEVAQ